MDVVGLIREALKFVSQLFGFYKEKQEKKEIEETKKERIKELQELVDKQTETERQINKGEIDELNKKFGWDSSNK
jgi:polyhydroxyalkanoate synthesis regulator phasin